MGDTRTRGRWEQWWIEDRREMRKPAGDNGGSKRQEEREGDSYRVWEKRERDVVEMWWYKQKKHTSKPSCKNPASCCVTHHQSNHTSSFTLNKKKLHPVCTEQTRINGNYLEVKNTATLQWCRCQKHWLDLFCAAAVGGKLMRVCDGQDTAGGDRSTALTLSIWSCRHGALICVAVIKSVKMRRQMVRAMWMFLKQVWFQVSELEMLSKGDVCRSATRHTRLSEWPRQQGCDARC